MDNQTIVQLIHSFVRRSGAPMWMTLDAIALITCREADSIIRARDASFDYERLFEGGEAIVHELIDTIPAKEFGTNWQGVAKSLYEFSRDMKNQLRMPSYSTILPQGAKFLLKVLCLSSNSSVYVPFAGDDLAPILYSDCQFTYEVQDRKDERLFLFYALAQGIKNLRYIASGLALEVFLPKKWSKETGDGLFTHAYIPRIPFGIQMQRKKGQLDVTFLCRLIESMETHSRAVTVLPESFLWSDVYRQLRRELLSRSMISAVIQLPTQYIYSSTRINTVALVIAKNYGPSFYYADLSSKSFEDDNIIAELASSVLERNPSSGFEISFEEVIEDGYKIKTETQRVVKIQRPGYKYVKLGDILEWRRRESTFLTDSQVPVLRGSSMRIKLPNYSLDAGEIATQTANGRYFTVTEPSLCVHSISRECVWFEGATDAPAYCNSDVYVFGIKDNRVSPEYICFILKEEDVVADLKALVKGVTIPRISREDFLSVQIPIPDKENDAVFREEVEKYLSTKKSELLASVEAEQSEALQDIREDIADKVHLLGPDNSTLQTSLLLLIEELKNSSDSEIDKNHLVNTLQVLYEKALNLGFVTATIGGNMFTKAVVPLEMKSFLTSYVQNLCNDDEFGGVHFELNVPDTLNECNAWINKRVMVLVLNTLVRNAVRHGFRGHGDGIISFSLLCPEGSDRAIVSVANNGNPVSDGFSLALYSSKGGKIGPGANTGRGGHYVARAMEFYGGSFGINTSDPKWPFIVKLLIPVSNE